MAADLPVEAPPDDTEDDAADIDDTGIDDTDEADESTPIGWFERGVAKVEQLVDAPGGLPFGLLLAFVSVWVVWFSRLVMLRQNRFGSFDFDAGIYDQAAWLTAHGMQFDTVRGLPLYGHHATFGFVFFAPFYWLGMNGPTVMNVAQVFTLGAVPLVVYWVARRLGLEPWIALVCGAVFLLHFSTSWVAQELFHPEIFAIAPLLAAYGFSLGKERKAYWGMLLLAVVWKEDVALAIVGLGAVLLFERKRRLGLATIAFGFVWFVATTKLLLPIFSPTGKAFYAEGFYGDLGNDITGIALTMVRHPTLVSQHLQRANAVGYVRDLYTPFGFVGLLAPETFLIALPQLAANLLSVNSFTWSLHFHYLALPLTAATLGLLLGLRRLRRPQLRGFAAGIVLAAALASSLSWGVGPFSKSYDHGSWPLAAPTNLAALEHAVSLVPGGAAVSASYHLVPHLSSRAEIYSFPNPFHPRNWGIQDKNQRNPKRIEWLAVERADMGADDTAIFERVLAADFAVVYDRDGVVVARRRIKAR